jgi:hypothetical protein
MPPKKTHTHPDGTVMTGATHTSKSKIIKMDDESKREILLARLVKAREAKAEKKIQGEGGKSSKTSPHPDEILNMIVESPIRVKDRDEERARLQAIVNADKERRAKEDEDERQRALEEYIRIRDAPKIKEKAKADKKEAKIISKMNKLEFAEYNRAKTAGMDGSGLEGGALSSKNLRGLLNASYESNANVGDFILDKGLSTSTSKVYHNSNNNQTVVAHRGTEGLFDWGNNIVYALGGKSAYKMTPRYKEAEAVQKQAESKYGKENVSTIGHSQGGLQSELLGGKSKEIITLNKATRPFESNENKNQTDVRSGRDVVSALNPFEEKSSKGIEIQGETYNPLTEHNPNILDRLDDDQMIGEEMVGGAVADQRNLAGILRQRFKDKDIEARLSNDKITAELFYSLLSQLVHSAEAEDINKIPDKNKNYEGWRKSQANNAYLDRANRYDYVRPFEYVDSKGNLQTTTPPPPDNLLKYAILQIVDFIQSRPDPERRAIVTKGAKGGLSVIKENLLENTKKGKRPQDVFADEREAINDAQEEYRQEAEQKGDKRGYLISKVKSQGKLIVKKGKEKRALKDTAFWTKDDDRRVIKMKEYATDMVNAWRIGDATEYNKIRTNFLNTTILNKDYNKWYDTTVKKIGQDETMDILDELKPFEKLTTDNITKKFNITAPAFRDRNLRGKHLITGVGDDIELTIQGKGLHISGTGGANVVAKRESAMDRIIRRVDETEDRLNSNSSLNELRIMENEIGTVIDHFKEISNITNNPNILRQYNSKLKRIKKLIDDIYTKQRQGESDRADAAAALRAKTEADAAALRAKTKADAAALRAEEARKAKALREAEKDETKSVSSDEMEGEGINKINFEDMNWGSLTEQMKAYNSQHKKKFDLEGFARMIVADPKSFQKRTLQRSRFYLNVLLPKKK